MPGGAAGRLPPAPEGELIFRRDQIEDLNTRQRDLSVAAYMREVAEEETQDVPVATLLASCGGRGRARRRWGWRTSPGSSGGRTFC